MIEAIVMLAVMVALAWVMFWSMLNENKGDDEPATGFFATKHDEKLAEKWPSKKNRPLVRGRPAPYGTPDRGEEES